jgi:expansin (peptidoglycan-binding protein)
MQDECPGCGYGSLDLSPAAFSRLANLNAGDIPISWNWA